MDLIKQLKEEHKEIIYSFDTLRENLNGRKNKEFNLILHLDELENLLINHLELENRLIYPAFDNPDYPELKKLSKIFSGEMLKISRSVMKFFKKYEDKELSAIKDSGQFKKEVENIITVVSRRIMIEETVLYAAYDKYCKE